MKEKSFVSVVFYVRNYANYIKDFYNIVIAEINNQFENFEVICVNNDTSDKSIEIVQKIHSEKYDNIPLTIINLSYCRSIEEATAAGLDLAIGDFIYEFRSIIVDYDSTLIYDSYSKLLTGKDIVFVSPNKMITLVQKMYYCIYNFGVKDAMKIRPERFKIYSRRTLNRVESISNYFYNDAAILKESGLENDTILYSPSNDHIKYDKDERSERINRGIESLIVHTYSIQKILSLICLITLVIAFINMFSRNWVFFVCFILTSVMIINLVLILIYLKTFLDISFKKQIHLIKSIEKF